MAKKQNGKKIPSSKEVNLPTLTIDDIKKANDWLIEEFRSGRKQYDEKLVLTPKPN